MVAVIGSESLPTVRMLVYGRTVWVGANGRVVSVDASCREGRMWERIQYALDKELEIMCEEKQ